MFLPPLNYRSLLILYGAAAATLLPFAVIGGYVHNQDWSQGAVLPVLFAAGIAVALFVWGRLEPRLLAHQPPEENLGAVAPEIIFSSVFVTSVAITIFAPAVITPFCKTRERTAAASPLVFECGTQSESAVPLQNPTPTSITIRVSGTF
jgi:hypothetical protein